MLTAGASVALGGVLLLRHPLRATGAPAVAVAAPAM